MMATGIVWALDGASIADLADEVPPGAQVTFSGGRDALRIASCNRFSGTSPVAGDRLSVSPLATTKMACAEHVMAQERVFLDAMGEVASHAIEGAQLSLLDGSGAMLLGFDGSAG